MKVELWDPRNTRDVDARMPGISWRVLDRQYVVFCVGISVENDVISNFGNVKRPIHLRIAADGDVIDSRADYAEQTKDQVFKSDRAITSCASDGCASSKTEFQERERLDIDLLAVNKWIWNVWMAFKSAKKVINSHRPDMSEKSWQKKCFHIHKPDHHS